VDVRSELEDLMWKIGKIGYSIFTGFNAQKFV
jgi:hypothetical protein